MRSDPASTSVRVLDSDEARELRQPHAPPVIRSTHQLHPPGVIAVPDGAEEGMVFDDGSPYGRDVAEEEHHRGHDSSEWAISRAQSRPPLQNRQWAAMGIATAIVLVLLIIGVLIGKSNHSGSQPAASTTTTMAKHQRATTTTTVKTPPTTTPSNFQPQAGATSTTASYSAPNGRYVLVVTATGGGCWTVATAQPGNSQLFVGTVAAGSPQQIPVTGGAQISLGAPGNVTVTLNGKPVVFPSGFQTPLVLSFAPAPVASPTTTGPAITSTTIAPTTTSTTQKP